jgi:glycerol-3-phosphate dehydrogenase (NAD(P)+)
MADPRNVCILGTGQMAVTCATLLCDNGRNVTLLGLPGPVEAMQRTRQSPHMPGVVLPEAARPTDDPAALADAGLVVCALPTQVIAEVLAGYAAAGARISAPVVSCAKGIELATMRRPSRIIADAAGPKDGGAAEGVAVLSGPNIAAEVIRRKPAGAVVACEDGGLAEMVRSAFATDYFRVYTNRDVIGVELAGALKNVIALAAGIIDGLSLGNNAKASLITRGIVEITRLGVSLGAQRETFYGLAGLGDLITTCVSPEGRNRTVGEAVGRGRPLDQVLAELGSVAEGVPTTRAVHDLARRQGVEMPIADAVYSVLFEGKPVREAIVGLMTREPRSE